MNNRIFDSGKLLNETRQQFEMTLTGSWIDILDYYPGPVQVCRFYSDGTGYLHVSSGMGDEVTWFEWRNAGPLTIETRFTDSFSNYSLEDCEDGDDEVIDDGNGLWTKHSYDFKIVDYYGSRAVLIWTSGSPSWITLCSEEYYFYEGALEGTAPNREHFITPP